VIFDRSGNLYGTTSVGGGGNCYFGVDHGCGAVFKLAPPALPGGAWTETTLYTFTGSVTGDQGNSVSGLVFDRLQKLYGVAEGDGNDAYGTLFSIFP
jgi:hypothetical protein